jgi:RHS repeat-associated protein
MLYIGGQASINHSTIEQAWGSGIYVTRDGYSTPTVIIQNSTIRNHYGNGITTNGVSPAIQSNSIYGNSNGVVNQSSSPIVDARNNWWGHDSGPYHPTLNPYGLGNAVSDNVLFDPWIGKTSWLAFLSSLSNPNTAFVAEPVNVIMGNYVYEHADLSFPSRGLPFAFQRTYNSTANGTDGPLGYGWTHSYNMAAITETYGSTNAVVIRRADGRRDKYIQQADGSYALPVGIYDTLTRTITGTYLLTLKDQTIYSFDSAGKLTAIADKNGNVTSLTYNGSLLTTVTLPDGRAVTFSYNASNRLTQIADPLSRTVQFTYNASGDLITVNDVRGFATSFVYDTSHRLTSITDANGHTFVQNTYDAGGRVTNQLDAQNNPTAFGYDQANRRTTVTDTLGNATVYTYDSEYRSTGEIDPLGHSTGYQYDGNSNRIAVTDKNSGVTRYAYDTMGNVTIITEALSYPATMTYDDQNNLLSQTDPLGHIKRYAYDSKSNPIVITDALGYTTTMTYYADAVRNGLLAVVTDARGNVTHYDYNAYGDRTTITDALSNAIHINYDSVGRKLSDVNARGYTTTYEYDAADHLVAVTDTLANRTSYAYDDAGNRVVITDAAGHPTQQTYNAKDQLVIITDTLGYTTVYTYNAIGKQIAVQDKNGHVTTYGYDPIGRLVTVTNPLNQSTVYAYDANGNRIAATDALTHGTTFAYDALNRLTTTTDPLGNVTRNGYDAVGNKTVITDANGIVTHYGYDALNHLTVVTDALTGTMQYAYDGVGNKTVMTDANSHVTVYTYDALNRLTRVSDPLLHTTAYGYDAIGNRAVLTDANGVVTVYTYDAANRPLTSQSPGLLVSNAYDALGNRTAMTDTTGTTTFAYDALSRLITTTAPSGVVAYRYDGVNRTQTIYPDSKTVTTTYDAADQLYTVADWAGRVTTYTYDAASRQIQLTYPNATTATYQYDNADRQIAITHTSAVSGTFAFFRYGLDNVGNRLVMTDTDGATRYTYDNLYRLTRVVYPTGSPVTVTYAYDPIGNRVMMTDTAVTTYTYDTADRLLNAGSTNFTWDDNGNMLSKGSITYSWDALNRLISVVSGTQTITFTYNGDGVRVGKSVNGLNTAYVQDIGQGIPYVLAESGSVNTNYVYGRDLIAIIDFSGTPAYYHYDAVGSARDLSNSAGQVTDAYWYDAFGSLRSSVGNSSNEFTFTGEQVDLESGLQFLRARYYDPMTGRFISRDPMSGAEMSTQTLNPYVYVENRSPNLIDPGGTTSKDSIYAYGGFYGGYGIGSIDGQAASILGAFRGELPWWWRAIGRIVGYKIQFGGIKIDPLNPFKAGSFGISPFDSDLLKGMRKMRGWQGTINDAAELNLYRQEQQFNQLRGDYGSDPMQAERISALRAIEVGTSHIPFPFNFMGGNMLKEYQPFSSTGERLARRTALIDRMVQTVGTPEFDQLLGP